MCGIAGIIDFKGNSNITETLGRLGSALNERGPDYEDSVILEGIGLIHKRLKIIDLSDSAGQPMYSYDENAIIVFNGEIYNFQELKKELEANRIAFKTKSDTEVLVNGYSFWGIEKLLSKLCGMFAFTIYDRKKNKLFCCRDRFGQKPLYFYKSNDKFAFSSDIKSFNKRDFSLTVNWNTINYFLSELSSPQPFTIWEEVQQIEPAHYLEINLNTQTYSFNKYWELDFNHKIPFKNENDILEELDFLLKKAVKRRLITDVPLGTFLSGGID